MNSMIFSLLLLICTAMIVGRAILSMASLRHEIRVTRKEVSLTLHAVNKKRYRRLLKREKQQLAETLVHTGTTTVEVVHKAISGLTFGILESIPATRHGSKVVRKVHDGTSTAVYGSIRLLNKAIGKTINQDWTASRPAVDQSQQ